MATVATKNFTALVTDFAASVQGASNILIDFTIGSVLRAIGQASSGVALWLQGLVLQAITLTRAATSQGSDLDSWMADFGVTRVAAVAATGNVSFSRVTASVATVVPVGAQVATGDGTQTFTVIAQPLNPLYSAGQNGYPVAIGVSSLAVPVQAAVGGAGGNVLIGTISVLKTGIPAIDSVTNASAFTNGSAAETDAALRARFVLFLNQLSLGTGAAIQFAIGALQSGLQSTVTENRDSNLTTVDNGMISVYIDDGSGATPGGVVTAAFNAANLVRAAGTRIGVNAATKLIANVTFTIATAAGYDHPTLVGQAAIAVTSYINGLGLGNGLPFTMIEFIAYGASPGITNVTGITVNGFTADLTATAAQTIKAGTVVVS